MDTNLDIAIKASIAAGEAIMEIYQKAFNVELKADNSPLTEADKKANDIINDLLLKTDIPIISEENREVAFSTRKKWTLCWMVDPLDGTKEFIKRNGEFTVNIALIEGGTPILGVIYVPEKRILYYAKVEEGQAFKVKIEETRVSCEELYEASEQITPEKGNEEKIKVVGSRSHMNEETKRYIASLKSENKEIEIVSRGSSLKFCLVAEGLATVYPRYAPTMEWDTAAGQAICNAVGVDVISLETQEPLIYNKENLLNSWFICK
ncbi:3'(2'),5'-bisphosphate nucleotidase CysQ [Sungkyunkwania multivorans]|uniref:3'(2'),5'-bisphosphate nucleotidase CysQ n=1 Tax=Sungkyunkwania multivorans TaxID=1173618 RepID=A0ABW3D025_9FLAO